MPGVNVNIKSQYMGFALQGRRKYYKEKRISKGNNFCKNYYLKPVLQDMHMYCKILIISV